MNKGYILTTRAKYAQSVALSSRLRDMCNFEVDVLIGITPDDEVFKKLASKNANPRFNGRDYLTPGEVCCGYGHAEILRVHMETDADKNLVVFEDDIILEADRVSRLTYLESAIDINPGIHILGGQHGLKLERYFFLRSILSRWPLFKFERMKVYRTCCYAISVSMLPKFECLRQRNMAFCVDDWNFVSTHLQSKVYFKNIFSRPTNLEASLIELERRRAK